MAGHSGKPPSSCRGMLQCTLMLSGTAVCWSCARCISSLPAASLGRYCFALQMRGLHFRELSQDLHPGVAGWVLVIVATALAPPWGGVDCVLWSGDAWRAPEAFCGQASLGNRLGSTCPFPLGSPALWGVRTEACRESSGIWGWGKLTQSRSAFLNFLGQFNLFSFFLDHFIGQILLTCPLEKT